MSDSDYIPAGERERCRGRYGKIDTSHAVADSVMRELAEALREYIPCGCGWCDDGPDSRCASSMALARFDALGGNDE